VPREESQYLLTEVFYAHLADSPVLPEICEILDFRTPEELPNSSRVGSSGVGSVFQPGRPHGRNLEEAKATSADAIIENHRRLQFQGERCRPSMIDTALDNPLLSNFVQLLDAADLADIFLCAGTWWPSPRD